MKPIWFKFIVIVASVSLAGIIITQVYWMNNAWLLKEEQFDSRVKVALKTVVNRLFQLRSGGVHSGKDVSAPACTSPDVAISNLMIDSVLLRTYLFDEFKGMDVDRGFFYAVFATAHPHPIMGRPGAFFRQITESPHAVSLSCLHEANVYFLSVYFPDKTNIIFSQLIGWMLLSVLFTGVIIFSFASTVIAFLKQRKLSEMKSDFVNNMTHELRTPVSAISLASEMLLKPAVMADKEKIERYASLIFDQNNRMKGLVEHVLQVSAFDRHEYQLTRSSVNLHELIEDIVASFLLVVEERHGSIRFLGEASSPTIQADRLYVTNILSSLVDNAIKYSPGAPFVSITTRSDPQGVYVDIADEGIGMNAQQRRMVFQKFFRVSTGNRHNVKGYGLGLYNAQVLARAHGGTITVASEPGKGSTFTLFLPFHDLTNLKTVEP